MIRDIDSFLKAEIDGFNQLNPCCKSVVYDAVQSYMDSLILSANTGFKRYVIKGKTCMDVCFSVTVMATSVLEAAFDYEGSSPRSFIESIEEVKN